MVKSVSRHEAWRQIYRAKRYCRHLTQTELNQRIRDIFLNMLRLTPEAKIGVPQLNPEGNRALQLWTDVLEEMAIRHRGPYPKGFTPEILHSEPFPDLSGELGKKAAAVMASKRLSSDNVFIKFGKADHMRSLFERGALRVQPATYYAESDHNGAIRDDELSLPLSFALSREDIIKSVLNPQDVPAGPLEQRLDITYRAGTNYWLYCVTSTVEPRLFVDFKAEACVIIKERDRFQRLLERQGTVTFPETRHRQAKVIYVDPLLPSTSAVDVPIAKHFRYSYQQEYRFVWTPEIPAANLPYVDLELGSLGGIAELVVL